MSTDPSKLHGHQQPSSQTQYRSAAAPSHTQHPHPSAQPSHHQQSAQSTSAAMLALLTTTQRRGVFSPQQGTSSPSPMPAQFSQTQRPSQPAAHFQTLPASSAQPASGPAARSGMPASFFVTQRRGGLRDRPRAEEKKQHSDHHQAHRRAGHSEKEHALVQAFKKLCPIGTTQRAEFYTQCKAYFDSLPAATYNPQVPRLGMVKIEINPQTGVITLTGENDKQQTRRMVISRDFGISIDNGSGDLAQTHVAGTKKIGMIWGYNLLSKLQSDVASFTQQQQDQQRSRFVPGSVV